MKFFQSKEPMKTYLLKLSLIALITLSITSCGSDDSDSSEPLPIFSVTVNGQQFSATSLPSVQMSNSNRYLLISATNINTSENITIAIGTLSGAADELVVGSYLIDGSTNTNLTYFDGSNGYQANDNGQITITALDTENRTISGSFNATASGSFGSSTVYTLSNGQFSNLSYSVQ